MYIGVIGATEKENTSPAKAIDTITKSKTKNNDSFFMPPFSHISSIIQVIANLALISVSTFSYLMNSFSSHSKSRVG